MNGAESLVRTLVKGGVESVSPIRHVGDAFRRRARPRRGMRCVLGLFEGVCSGAADGYYHEGTSRLRPCCISAGSRQCRGQPAQRQEGGLGHRVNIVGEHALYHIKYDTPLTADIEGIARPFSHWVKTSPTSDRGGRRRRDPGRAPGAGPDRHLILPADTAWTRPRAPPIRRRRRRAETVERDCRRGGQGTEAARCDAVHRWPFAARPRSNSPARSPPRPAARCRAPAARAHRARRRPRCRCCACTS